MERLSRYQFVYWLRTGRVPADESNQLTEMKFNPNHDPKNGQFTFAAEGGSGGGEAVLRILGNTPTSPHTLAPNRIPNHDTTRSQTVKRAMAERSLKERQSAQLSQVKRDLADPKVQAFIDLVADRESGSQFDTIVGGTKFRDFSRHPNVYVKKFNSTAAGAYQFNSGTWKDVSSALGLTDFTPQSQKYGAVYLLRHLGVIKKLQNDDVSGAILAACQRWDSFPKYPDGRSASGAKHSLKAVVDAYTISLSRHMHLPSARPHK